HMSAGDRGIRGMPPEAGGASPTAPDDHGAKSDEEQESHRLTALEGLAALSLDALSSVAYGPEAIVVVLAVLVVSYRQVIAAFPSGGGAYAVAKKHLGTMPSLVAAGSLVVDYIL